MNKNAKILIILLLAVVMAVLAGFAVVSFLSPRRATVYVFKSAYSIGTQLTSDMLVPIQVDSSIIVAGREANANEKLITSDELRPLLESGDSLKVSVGEGTPLMRSLLSISGGNSIMMSMAPSSVAVTVSVDNTTGVTQELYSGASVNVYVTSYSGGTFLLFENMRVLDLNRKTNGELSSVTLEVSNEQAVKLINSTKNGAIHLGLINPNGYQYESGASGILVNPEVQETATPENQSGTGTSPDNPGSGEIADDIIQPVSDSDVIEPED